MYEYAKNNGFITDEDAYLDSITERQDFNINMTSMADDEIASCITTGAELLNQKLNLGLSDLIKTGDQHNRRTARRNRNDVSLDYSNLSFDD